MVRCGVAAGAVLTMGSYMALPSQSAHATDATPTAGAPAAGDGEWIAYGRDPGRMHHSPLTQITQENVQDLVVVGTYHTAELTTYNGTLLAESAAFEATPLMVDGVLYLATATNRVVALDAGTGAELWVFDPKIYLTREYAEVASRGVSTWVDPEKDSTDAGYR
jgi:quinoprotein glucose dehydrogenase